LRLFADFNAAPDWLARDVKYTRNRHIANIDVDRRTVFFKLYRSVSWSTIQRHIEVRQTIQRIPTE